MTADASKPSIEPFAQEIRHCEQMLRCPLHEADDRHLESLYFLGRMLEKYHSPDPFRWNLNAFLQALRSVTLFIQSQLAHHAGFGDWYAKQQEIMRTDPLLRRFNEGRTHYSCTSTQS
jgi:hypothetical protein